MRLKQIAIIAAVLVLVLLVGSMIASTELTDQASLDWQPAELSTAVPTLTQTPGWWGDMPTPVPLRTPTPTTEGTN